MTPATVALYFLPLAGLDCGSTAIALNRGAVETNPLFKTPSGCLAVHAAVTAPLLLIDAKTEPHRRKKLRLLVLGLELVGGGLIAEHNLQVRPR